MKKTLMLVALTLTFAFSLPQAHAAVGENNDYRLYKFVIDCAFTGSTSTDTCSSVAKVYAYVDENGHMHGGPTALEISNKLAVSCDGELLYANGANLSIDERGIAIRGLEGRPAIFVKRGDTTTYAAILRFTADDQISGTCTVKNNPVHSLR